MPPYTDAQAAAAAPVKSVNTLTGSVAVPTICRQTGAGTPDASGNVTWVFPNTVCTFASAPTCYPQITATNTNYIFAAPTTAGATTAAVTFNMQAALKILSISLGALTIWTAPPAGTTLNLTCTAPPQ